MARDTGRANSKPRARPKGRPAKARGGFWRFVRHLLLTLVLILVVVPPISVIVYKVVPAPITILMITRLIQGHGMDYQWRSLRDMSPSLPAAAVASEDSLFCSNHGFDFDAIEKAMKNNERRPNRIRGGSTISQQTAKNVFLWPHRDYVRKGLEAWFTVLIETIWGKPRIMEVYLNSIEWGPGVYGAEAAAQANFHESAAQLNPAQAARLAAIIPKPLTWKAARPGPYIQRRQGHITAAAGTIRRDGLADCVLK
jgi:monofunctional glycosyltransferase